MLLSPRFDCSKLGGGRAVAELAAQFVSFSVRFFDLSIQLGPVVVVVRQCAVNLPESEMRVLSLNLLGVPPVGNSIQRDVAYPVARPAEARDAFGINFNMDSFPMSQIDKGLRSH